jgi:O-antigen biosynthesis protein
VKSLDSPVGLTSIIVPCWNALEFTRHCVAALKTNTRGPWELILIDNGSTDGTDIYLRGVQDGATVPVTMISNTTNRGFPAAINQGLKAARGDYLVLLNNDAVVTNGWLGQLIALAHMEDRSERVDGSGTPRPAIGLVGPMSNYAAPPQLVENVPYHDLRAMHDFARKWRDDHRGKWFTARKLSGFCLLMKRVVYETIGGLDERFGVGFFDDDDLAERARRAGFELAVAHDLFIHHFGSRTFKGNEVDAQKLLDENARRFADKWGLKETNGKPVALRPWQEWPPFFAESQRAFAALVDEGVKPRVSLTMIVRDEENHLSSCLESVRG